MFRFALVFFIAGGVLAPVAALMWPSEDDQRRVLIYDPRLSQQQAAALAVSSGYRLVGFAGVPAAVIVTHGRGAWPPNGSKSQFLLALSGDGLGGCFTRGAQAARTTAFKDISRT